MLLLGVWFEIQRMKTGLTSSLRAQRSSPFSQLDGLLRYARNDGIGGSEAVAICGGFAVRSVSA
jgi:hypothetical protein